MESFKNNLIRRATNLALEIIKFIDRLNKKDYTVVTIIKQLLRSITSIGANIIEAQAASSRRDFINFLNHALKSANESKFWLNLLKDSNKAPGEQCKVLLQETNELANILASSIITLKENNKFKF